VFAVQDALFNTAFVGAMVVAAAVLPLDGVSPGLVLVGAALYLVAAVAVWHRHPRGVAVSAPMASSDTIVSVAAAERTDRAGRHR